MTAKNTSNATSNVAASATTKPLSTSGTSKPKPVTPRVAAVIALIQKMPRVEDKVLLEDHSFTDVMDARKRLAHPAEFTEAEETLVGNALKALSAANPPAAPEAPAPKPSKKPNPKKTETPKETTMPKPATKPAPAKKPAAAANPPAAKKPASNGEARKQTVRERALRAVLAGGEMTAGEIQETIGLGHGLKPTMDQEVERGNLLAVETEGKGRKYKITAQGRKNLQAGTVNPARGKAAAK